MSIEQAVLENLRELTPEAKRQVLTFAERLRRECSAMKSPLKDLRGLWADLQINLTDDDLAEARKQMWGNFPREIDS